MPKIAEILLLERTRPQASDLNLVHIYKTGTFYTAYDYSAWLMAVISYNDEIRMQSRDRKPLAGVLSHSASYNLRREIFDNDALAKVIEIDENYLKSKLIA